MSRHPIPISILFIFVGLLFAWGLSWPISKLGLDYMPPLWFSVSRLSIGCLAMFVILAAIGKLKIPTRQDIPLLLSIALLQMSAFLVLINLGMTDVSAGRAAILAYSTPLWVSPMAILFFGEIFTKLKGFGLLLGLLGILILFSPWTFDWGNTHLVLGNIYLLLAALAWALAMLHIRYATWHSTPLVLVPWQLLIGVVVVTSMSLLLDPEPTIEWNPALFGAMLYTGLIATAFGYWGVVVISRYLPVITTSLALLLTPLIGLFASALILGEPITWNLLAAMGLIIAGLAAVAVADWRLKRQAAAASINE